MNLLDVIAEKVAAAPAPIKLLLTAKQESDRRNYGAKHALLRQLIMAEPHQFEIDSEENGIVGLTHVGNGFKIHIPRTALPTVKLKRRPVKPAIIQRAAAQIVQ